MSISRLLLDVIPFTILVLLLPPSAACGRVPLVQNGQSDYVIVLAEDASASERFAADELQSHLAACTGVTLPIVAAAEHTGEPAVRLGWTAAAGQLAGRVNRQDLGPQGFVIATAGRDLLIAGTPAGGTLYGVHRFLEDYLGVRWYAPGVTDTPATSRVIIEDGLRVERPAFLMRWTDYNWPGGDATFRTRVGQNAGSGTATDPLGAQYAFDGICHTYFRYVSPSEFFDQHPEYFSEINGQRQRHETQLCLTNPDVLEIVTQRMLARMRANPHARQHNFSQMDYYNVCQCAECRAMNERYGTQGGTQFWFVNELAARTAVEFPDKLIGTLAYMYTEEPPRDLRMHPNVAVWLCHMFPCCHSHPITTCPRNGHFADRARRWAQICDHLYIWHYIVNFAHYYSPFPNLRAMAADMRFYRDIGVEGVFLQGMGHGGGGGEFSLLRSYYGLKLLWNPDQAPETLIADFLHGYYGAAAAPIHRYINLLHDKVERQDIHMHLYTNPAQGYLTDEVLADAEALFDRAERAVADDATLLERVRVARMPLTYARMFPRNGYRIEGDRLSFVGPMAGPAEIGAFLRRMQAHGFATIREHGGEPVQLAGLSQMFHAGLEVVSLENRTLAADVVPFLGGRLLRLNHRPSGQTVTAWNEPRSMYFPYAGGLEHRVGEIFNPSGWIEPAVATRSDDGTVVLRSQTMEGLNLVRTLWMDPDEPILHIVARLSNPSDSPRASRLRAHLELDLGELDATRVSFRNRAGASVVLGAGPIVANMREGVRLYNGDCPAGLCTFSGDKGLDVVVSFPDEQVAFVWLYAYPEDLGQFDVEFWGPQVTLAPGESASLETSLIVRPTRR